MTVDVGVLAEVLETEAAAEADDLDLDSVQEQRRPEDDVVAEEDDVCGPMLDPDDGDGDEGGAPLDHVTELNGIPLLYRRGPDGKPHPREFVVDPAFRRQLEGTITLVVSRAPEAFGPLTSLTSAGMLVKKPGMHGLGRAVDWDDWTFADAHISPFRGDDRSPQLARRQRYWALAALCRSSSAYVLHAHFNAAHKDHIHQDNGAMMPFDTSSAVAVKLVQALCNEVYALEPTLKIDGTFGQKSRDAAAAARDRLHLDGDFSSVVTWRRFLRRSGRLGFRLSV